MSLAWNLLRGKDRDAPSLGLTPSEGLRGLMLPQHWSLVTGVPRQLENVSPGSDNPSKSRLSWRSLQVMGLSELPLKTEGAEGH